MGKTSLRPRCGEPAGPAATRWPFSAASSPSLSPSPCGPRAKMCNPSPYWLSLMSQTKRSIRVIASAAEALLGMARSSSTPCACASSRMARIRRSRRAGSMPSAVEYSSKSRSRRANAAGIPASAKGGGIWPRVTAPMRRLAWAASPGSLTMKG